MNRKYKAPHLIAVLDTNGNVINTVKRVPYSSNGFDSYKYNGAIYPGYWNGAICINGIQAFIKVYGVRAAA